MKFVVTRLSHGLWYKLLTHYRDSEMMASVERGDNSQMSPQAKSVKTAITNHLRSIGISEVVRVRTETTLVRSHGESYREYGHASSDPMRVPTSLDLEVLASEINGTVYVVSIDPTKQPLFWLTSQYAKGGRVVKIDK